MPSYVAFDGPRAIAEGPRADVIRAMRAALQSGAEGPLLAFNAETGAGAYFDLRASFEPPEEPAQDPVDEPPRGRGRPKLGVVAREVTLLPRHWDWLGQQPGGASVALRKLVEDARRADGGATQARQAKTAVYLFLSAIAGDLPGFEEVARDLFADRYVDFARRMETWPGDIRAFALRRLSAGQAVPTSQS